ncbi:UNVERIFIED_CONTAM: PH, RCC1 and FYVE domains-containing protein 1 [Sesamum radiatum]|uniref:PH, RCC1 and FYVE domains-containing protein 1 n=1 Tax=Sesamum radiatum TaxID=300843 RepID=A0AAW2RZG3_SESRA
MADLQRPSLGTETLTSFMAQHLKGHASKAIFQRYPRPEKEYQSFSLIYSDRSLDLICKDKDEAEVWFAGLKALIARANYKKARNEARHESASSDCLFGRSWAVEYSNTRTSGADTLRVSLSSAVSSSSQGSGNEDFDNLGDVFIWGEGTDHGVMGGGLIRVGRSSNMKVDALLPKALDSTVVLDVQNIACACGEYHTCAVTLSGDLYTWGDGSLNCGLLGHGSEASHWIPKRVGGPLDGLQVSFVSCGPWHTALLASPGRLFTFGDGTFGALGHGSRSNTSIPREVEALKGVQTLRVACGAWHTQQWKLLLELLILEDPAKV